MKSEGMNKMSMKEKRREEKRWLDPTPWEQLQI
jgi:hypothetical protein